MSQNIKASVDTPDSFETRTRKIFHELHKQQGENAQIFQRLTALLTPTYLQVPEDFFHGKICLDAGCGSNANATYSMLQQGAARVYAFDLNDTIFETVPRHLQAFEGKYILSTDNVLQMRFEDNFFDVVHCSWRCYTMLPTRRPDLKNWRGLQTWRHAVHHDVWKGRPDSGHRDLSAENINRINNLPTLLILGCCFFHGSVSDDLVLDASAWR